MELVDGENNLPYRVLIIAEAANPEWTSVPLIGWKLSRALAKIADVHLITQIRNREAIVRSGEMDLKDFSCIDNERVAASLYKLSEMLRGGGGKGWTTVQALSSVAYYSFEWQVWREFKERLVSREFDLVHRITPLSPTSPSIIAKKLAKHKIPFLIGPLNGGTPWPKYFVDRQHAEAEWLSHIRYLYKLMPGYRQTRQYSDAIIVGSRFTEGDMPDWARAKCIYIPENGVDARLLNFERSEVKGLPLEGGFVGRLVPYKGADILLEACAGRLRSGHLVLHIVGDGPQKGYLEEMAERLEVKDRVHFHGWVSHEGVLERLRHFDFLALPSVREFGGGVVVESMALGVAPIVADYGGPSELVDDETGIRVPFQDKVSLVEGFRCVIEQIIQTPNILNKLGKAAREHVRRDLTWDAKARQIAAVYETVLSRGVSERTCREVSVSLP